MSEQGKCAGGYELPGMDKPCKKCGATSREPCPEFARQQANEIARLRGELERFGALYDKADKEAADEIASLREQHRKGQERFQELDAEIASLRAQLDGNRAAFNLKCAQLDKAEAQLASARKALEPFALLADLDAKDKDGLETVYVMVAAGRLHDARRVLSQTDEEGKS